MKNTLVVNAGMGKQKIDKNIYGHFAEHLGRCIYDGIWVGEDSSVPNVRGMRKDVIEALKRIKAPVIRWPGGCFADEYHWKDGVGPRPERKRMTNTHWGGIVENNHFGTHEFFDFCGLVGAEPYICGNVGSGTIQEMQEWIEYMNASGDSDMAALRAKNGRKEPFGIKYFGVGNENWGCGGRMRAEYYADIYRRYQTYVRKYGDNSIFKIACGPKNDDYHWTEVLMREAGDKMDGLALHYYTRLFSSGENKAERRGSALDFDEEDWFLILRNAHHTEELVSLHSAVMDRYDPEKRVALVVDEWGTWFEVEPGTNPDFLFQQNTMRDALVAGMSLNIFNNHCDRVRMANIAQTINVLQAMALTEGTKLLLTPTYHVFDLYKTHQDATLLPSLLECEEYAFKGEAIPKLSASASVDRAGKIHVSICNVDPKTGAELRCVTQGRRISGISGSILSSGTMNAHNSFDRPDALKPKAFDGFKVSNDEIEVGLPPMSVLVLEVS